MSEGRAENFAAAYSRPEGFPDWGPTATRTRRALESKLLRLFEGAGTGATLALGCFQEVQPPTLEYGDLYTAGSVGPKLRRSLIEARGAESRDFPGDGVGDPPLPASEFVLRPEMTAPLCRMYACAIHGFGDPEVVKVVRAARASRQPVDWSYAGQVFRNVSPTKEKLKEYRQVGVEVLGAGGVEDDLRVLRLGCATMAQAGVEDYELRVGHIGVLKAALRAAGIGEQQAIDRVITGIARLRRATLLVDDAEKLEIYLEDKKEWLKARFEELHGDSGKDLDRGLLKKHLVDVERDLFQRTLTGTRQDKDGRGSLKLDADQTAAVVALAAVKEPEELLGVVKGLAGTPLACEFRDLLAEARKGCKSVSMLPESGRNLGYYTGFTFELHVPRGDRRIPYTGVGGGGRYSMRPIFNRLKTYYSSDTTEDQAAGVGFAVKLDLLAALSEPEGGAS